MWSSPWWLGLVLTIVLLDGFLCDPVSTIFNKNIRSYSVKEDDNSTARTLQQEDLGRYANFAPVTNTIKFKEEVPDNALSGSDYSRGLLHHDHGGYGLHEYDDGHYSYGYDYDHHGSPHGHHGLYGHHLGHGHGHGFHHKHYNPVLAAKTILWPLAGLAILGTAAALVSNPVLLQLGVISGRRRRRDTQEITGPDFDFNQWKKDVTDDEANFKPYSIKKVYSKDNKKVGKGSPKKTEHKDVRQGVLSRKAYQIEQSTPKSVTVNAPKFIGNFNEDRFVPIPLTLKVKKN